MQPAKKAKKIKKKKKREDNKYPYKPVKANYYKDPYNGEYYIGIIYYPI